MQDEAMKEPLMAPEEDRGEMENKWLTFWMDSQLFGVSIAGVEQIIGMQPITGVPEYPPYARGIINLRGSIIPLIDLRLRLGRAEVAYNERTCIIINQVEDSQLGFIVDEVDEVVEIPADYISAPPRMGDDTVNRYLTGIARLVDANGTEKMILCVDAAKIIHPDDFALIAKGEMGNL